MIDFLDIVHSPLRGYTLGTSCYAPEHITSSLPTFPHATIGSVLLPLPDGTQCRVDAMSAQAFNEWIDAVLTSTYTTRIQASKRATLLDGLDTVTWPLHDRWYVLNELRTMLGGRWNTLFQVHDTHWLDALIAEYGYTKTRTMRRADGRDEIMAVYPRSAQYRSFVVFIGFSGISQDNEQEVRRRLEEGKQKVNPHL